MRLFITKFRFFHCLPAPLYQKYQKLIVKLQLAVLWLRTTALNLNRRKWDEMELIPDLPELLTFGRIGSLSNLSTKRF